MKSILINFGNVYNISTKKKEKVYNKGKKICLKH